MLWRLQHFPRYMFCICMQALWLLRPTIEPIAAHATSMMDASLCSLNRQPGVLYKIDTLCVCELQTLSAAKGDLARKLSDAKKQAEEQEEKAKKKVEALKAAKRELQVSCCSRQSQAACRP